MRTSVAVVEEEEEFYESLDRILSSSCSSTSASDDDADHQHHHRVPQLPSPVIASYDVWIFEPSSVEECRRRLLHQISRPHLTEHQLNPIVAIPRAMTFLGMVILCGHSTWGISASRHLPVISTVIDVRCSILHVWELIVSRCGDLLQARKRNLDHQLDEAKTGKSSLSIEECRHRLLHQMGLAADPDLSHA